MPNPSEIERLDQENRDEMARVSGQVRAATPGEIEQRKQEEAALYDSGSQSTPIDSEFEKALCDLLNRHSMENASDTPDFILARYLRMQLDTFSKTVVRRETWYGR